jgi:hypothetical protein
MADETTTAETTEGEAPTYEEQVLGAEAAEQALLESASEILDAPEAEPEPEPDAAEEDGDSETDAAPEEDGEGEGDEEEAKPDEVPTPWQIQRMKRYKLQAEKKLAEAKQQAEQVHRWHENVKAREVELENLVSRFGKDPLGAFEAFAKRAGTTAADLYQMVTQQQLGEQNNDASAAMRRVKALEDQIARERQERAAEQQRQVEQSKKQGYSDALQQDAAWIVSQKADYPFLAVLPPDEVSAMAAEAVDHAVNAGLNLRLDQIATFLDQRQREVYETLSRANGSREGDGPAAQAASNGQGTAPAQRAKPGRKRPRAVTNTHAAETSGTAREKSNEELLAEADAILKAVL